MTEDNDALIVHRRGHKLLGFYGLDPDEELLKKFDEKLDPMFDVRVLCPQCGKDAMDEKRMGTFFRGLEIVLMVSAGQCPVCKKISCLRNGLRGRIIAWVSPASTTEEAVKEGVSLVLEDNVVFEVERAIAGSIDPGHKMDRPGGGKSGFFLN